MRHDEIDALRQESLPAVPPTRPSSSDSHTPSGALPCTSDQGPISAENLVIVTDGTDLDALRPSLERVTAESTKVLLIGADATLLGRALPHAAVIPVS